MDEEEEEDDDPENVEEFRRTSKKRSRGSYSKANNSRASEGGSLAVPKAGPRPFATPKKRVS